MTTNFLYNHRIKFTNTAFPKSSNSLSPTIICRFIGEDTA